MHIHVRLFGGLTERVGAPRTTVEVADTATVADLRAALARTHPELAGLLPSTNVAIDLEVATDDTPVVADQEVALLPPVAGGAGDDAAGAGPTSDGTTDGGPGTDMPLVETRNGVRVLTGLHAPPFDVDGVTAQIGTPAVGGSVAFLGTVRDHAGDLDDVVALEYSAYPAMARKVLDDIADELIDTHQQVAGIALLHAVGELPVGAHTILIVCAAAHRAAAFDACRDALERVKDRVPVWKREITADGTHRWVGLTPPPDDPARSTGTVPDPVRSAPGSVVPEPGSPDDAAAPGVRGLPPAQAAALLERPDTVLLDIRTPPEIAQAALPGAIHLDFHDPAFPSHVAELDRDATYLMYCRSGARSGHAQQLLRELGFRDVVDLEGGLIAWVNAGYPLAR